MGVKSILLESLEHLSDMILVVTKIIRVDQDVVQINENTYVEEIGEDVIHKTLKSGGGVGKSERHNTPLKRTIASAEHGFPLVTFMDPDKMIGMPEVDFGEVTSFLQTIQEIRDSGERILVFLRDLVQAMEIDTEAEGAILFPDEDYRSPAWGPSWADEAIRQMLV